jgi:hypothetical protein
MIYMILAFLIIIAFFVWLLRETNNLNMNLALDVKQKHENKEHMPVIEPEESRTDLRLKRTIQRLWFNFETFCGTTTYVNNCSTSQNMKVFYTTDKERAETLNIDLTKYDK